MGVPSRRIGKSYRSSTGFIQSAKDQSSHEFESRLERDLLLIVNADPSVASFQVQPEPIPYLMASGKPSHYTPDLLVEFSADPATGIIPDPWLIEVKYREELWDIWPEYRQRIRMARLYAAQRGMKFKILTEYEIRTKYLAAIKPYASYLTREVDEAIRQRLLGGMKELGECRVQDLLEKAVPDLPHDEAVVALRCLLARREIWIDLSKPVLRPTSILRVAEAPDPAFCWRQDGPPLRERRRDTKLLPVRPGSGPVSFRLQPGREAMVKSRPCTILALEGFQNCWVRFHDTGAREVVPNSEISMPGAADAPPVVMPDLLSIDEMSLSKAEKRLEILSPLLSRERTFADVQKAADKLNCSPATIYRYVKKYEASGLMTTLLPSKPNGGRGKARLDDRISEIIDDQIETYYLTFQKPSVADTFLKIKSQCDLLKIALPSVNTVHHRLKLIPEYEKTKRRLGLQVAKEKFEVTRGSFPDADKPYAFVQIDHTPTDVILIDRETGLIIGRAWLTVAIDVYSRMILGYYVSLDAPSCNLVGLCISHAVLPKTRWLERYGITAEWPCEGLFDTLHTDNAGEFSGSYMTTLCNQYGINFTWRPLGSKNYGGHVERLLGTICRQMHCLPGTTFSDVEERGEYPSEKHAAMTIEGLEEWLAHFICEVYHNRVHSALDGQTPLERFREGILGSSRMMGFGQPRKIALDAVDRFRIDMLPYVERTVQREGLSIEGLKYNDFGLSKFRKESPTARMKKHIIRYDPGSMRLVYLWDQEAQEHVPIPFANTGKDDISLWEHRAIKKIVAAKGEDPRNEYAVMEGQRAMDRIVAEAVSTKQSRRLKVKRQRNAQGAVHLKLGLNSNSSGSVPPVMPQQTVNGESVDSPFSHESAQNMTENPRISPLIIANAYENRFKTRRK